MNEPIVTARGFLHGPAIPDTSGGTVKVYESSALSVLVDGEQTASGPFLWLRSEQDRRMSDVSMHLDYDAVQTLRAQLTAWSERHK